MSDYPSSCRKTPQIPETLTHPEAHHWIVEALLLTPAQLAVVAEFGPLYNARKVWAPKEKRYKALCIEIQSWYPTLPAGETALATGMDYDVQVGEQATVKDWGSLSAVCKAVGGWQKLLKLCTVTFKAVSGVIGITAAAAMQVEAQTGYRKLTAVARVAPAANLPLAIVPSKAA
jgi:hypothetical protein